MMCTADALPLPLSRDEWESRVGVAHGLGRLPLLLSPAHCMTLLLFLIPEALADCSSLVRDAMMEAAREAIAAHGEVGDAPCHDAPHRYTCPAPRSRPLRPSPAS